MRENSYVVPFFELIVSVSLNNGGFSDTLIAKENDSKLLRIAIAM